MNKLHVCLRISADNYNQEKFAEILKQEKKLGNINKLVSYNQVTEDSLKFMEVVIEINDKSG